MAGTLSTQPIIAPNPSIGGAQPLPGESWSNFLARTGIYRNMDASSLKEAEDAFKVAQLQQQQISTSTNALDTQTALQKTRLNDLAKLLAEQNDKQFNLDIPQIAETAQNQGFLETSGFGNALANRRAQLTATSDAALAEQALADRDLQIKGIGDITTNTNNLGTAGLQRTFSTEDTASAQALARELAKYGVQAPAPQPSTLDKALQYGGPLLSGGAAIIGGTNPITGAKTGLGGSHLCTHMENLGIMNEKEIKEIHKKIFPVLHNHKNDYDIYNIQAPIFITLNPDYDWKGLKKFLYDDVLNCDTNEQAFQVYKSKCLELFGLTLTGVK